MIRSDNGTDFHGRERELRDANRFMCQQNIKWFFNPPTASHMGGIWERIVQSVKKILKALLSEQIVGDESLLTVMAEAEAIVNSPPLTSNPQTTRRTQSP